MVKPFALQSVFDLAQSRTDEATLQLARLLSAERSAKDKLGLLQQYRDEYAMRFQQAAQNGLSPHQWNNYQEFLGRIDEAGCRWHPVAGIDRDARSGKPEPAGRDEPAPRISRVTQIQAISGWSL